MILSVMLDWRLEILDNKVFISIPASEDSASDCSTITVGFYNSAMELVFHNLVYAYLEGSSEGTIFSNDVGVLIGSESFENVLSDYKADLRYGGILQFIVYAWGKGINFREVQKMIGSACGRFIEVNSHEFDKTLKSVWEYAVKYLRIPESDINSSDDITVLSDRLLLEASVKSFRAGDVIFGMIDYSSMREKLHNSECNNYAQFLDLVDTMEKVYNFSNRDNFTELFELCLLQDLENLLFQCKIKSIDDFWKYI